MNKSPILYHLETQNLLLVLAMVVFVPFIWWLVPGWHPSDLLSQHDNLQMGYILQREFIRAGGDWTEVLYWPQLAGGVKVHDITGSLPLLQFLAYLGATPLIISNSLVLFLQILFAYLCTRISFGLSQVVYQTGSTAPYLVLFLTGILFAFLPILGWRLPYGHDNIVSGLFVLLCFICLLLEEMTDRRSVISLMLCFLALCHTFQHSGYQLIYYSVVFGAPIILALTFAYPGRQILERCRWYIFPALVFLAALLVSLPKYYGMLSNSLGDEMSRAEGSQVIYSYTTALLGDWLSSLPWSADFIPKDRPGFIHQEINYPLGPIVLLMMLVKPTAPFAKVAVGLGISLFMVLIVSMNISPLSTLMTSVIPLLESFRVPARAMLPLLVFISMLAVAAVIKLISVTEESVDRQGQYWLLAALALVLFAINSPVINDVLLIVFMLVIFILTRMNRLSSPLTIAMLAIISGAGISAFTQRALPPLKNPISHASVSNIRRSVLAQVPELEFPLNRVSTDIQLKGIGFNSIFFMDLSSLSAYWFPFKRYSQLAAELNGEQFHPAVSIFHNHPAKAGYEVLNRLYNVAWVMTFEAGQTLVKPLDEPWGAAWLSDQIVWRDSLPALVTALKTQHDKRKLLLLSIDRQVEIVRDTGQSCQIIAEPVVAPSQFPLTITLAVKGQCFLTVSTNYSEILHAVDQHGNKLATFPAYGALLGILVDDSSSHISITARPTTFAGSSAVLVAGFLLVLGLMLFVLKYPIARIFSPRAPSSRQSPD